MDSQELFRLRAGKLEGATPSPLQDLLERAGVASARPVYELSADEVTTDKYGFAREFSLTIKEGIDLDTAIAMLASSKFVEDVRPVLLRRTSRD